MSRILFTPFSIAGSLIAGLAARRVFDRIWSVFDDQVPPEAGEEAERWPKILAAAALQGAVFSAARALFDRQARRTFRGLTGSWPGPRDKA